MRILLLCDRGAGARGEILRDCLCGDHDVRPVTLSAEAIRPCLGCFGCWVRTPGMCVIADGANEIARAQVRADAVVLLSRITFGGFSADTKAFLDRSIQNIRPDFEIVHGEMHHAMRYARFPIWIAVGYGAASRAEGETFAALAERNARNLRPPRHLGITVEARYGRDAGTELRRDAGTELRWDAETELRRDARAELRRDAGTELRSDAEAELRSDAGTELQPDAEAELRQAAEAILRTLEASA